MFQHIWLSGPGQKTLSSAPTEYINVSDACDRICGDVFTDGLHQNAGVLSDAGSIVWSYDHFVHIAISKGVQTGRQ